MSHPPAMARAGPGQSWEPGTQPGSPVRMAMTHKFEPSPAAFQRGHKQEAEI